MDGRILVDPSQIEEEAVDYVSKIFEEEEWVRPEISGAIGKSLSMSERRQLEEQFSEEEVMLAVKDCCSFKAPGPRWVQL